MLRTVEMILGLMEQWVLLLYGIASLVISWGWYANYGTAWEQAVILLAGLLAFVCSGYLAFAGSRTDR